MPIPELEHECATARYDQDTGIVYITYSGLLDSSVSTAVYDWLADLIATLGIDQLYGEIFDFRAVTEFMPENLIDARRNSRRYNMKNNVKKLPVAMIVKDFVQEEILRVPMQNVKENERKTIVQNMDDAVAFLHAWHKAHDTA